VGKGKTDVPDDRSCLFEEPARPRGRSRLPVFLLIIFVCDLLVTTGLSCSVSTNPKHEDAGSPFDGGGPDSGPQADAGLPEDSGVRADSGFPTDAGVTDSGVSDAGAADGTVSDGTADGAAQDLTDGGNPEGGPPTDGGFADSSGPPPLDATVSGASCNGQASCIQSGFPTDYVCCEAEAGPTCRPPYSGSPECQMGSFCGPFGGPKQLCQTNRECDPTCPIDAAIGCSCSGCSRAGLCLPF
jgi:hypothetical protein